MYNTINPNILRKAGDYLLSDVTLISYQSTEGSSRPKKISIRDSIGEINIYESIHSKTLSGDVSLADSQNIIKNLPLTGFERIEFTFYTPSSPRGFNFSEKTGFPMYVYKISNRQEGTPGTQIYSLHFASKEFIRNEQVKCSQAFSNTFDNVVIELLRNQSYLDSKKDLFVEETKGTHKVVVPRQRPFAFIDYLSKNSQSKAFENAGMYFYETANGFNFRSIESMLATTNNIARPVIAKFVSKPQNIEVDPGVVSKMQIAENVSIISQFDSLKNTRNGAYASRILIHDLFSKEFKEIDYDYHIEFEKSFHTEHDGKGGKNKRNYALPLFPDNNNNFISDNSEGTLYYQSSTTKLHEKLEPPPAELILQKVQAQRSMLNSMKISLEVPGFTGLSAGDLIAYEMPNYEPQDNKDVLAFDPYMSGRYIVESIRHQFNVGRDKHMMFLECIKDTVRLPYPVENVSTTVTSDKEPQNVLQSKLDEAVIQETTRSSVYKI